MAEELRFSSRPNRAAEIPWRGWSADAFDEATAADRPVLLNLTAVWCHQCHLMDETTYSDPTVIELLTDDFVPIRVDADRNPHVQDRYIAGGWPTNAFLTPTGEVLWAGTFVEPAEFRRVAVGVLEAWKGRRDELTLEIERRNRAMHAARSRKPSTGLVRREAADDVVSAAQDAFDARNGGFGDAPKFPPFEAIELLYAQEERLGGGDWELMAERTLDGILAGELHDRVDGGFYRYALQADWTEPRYEKLLEINAGLLRAFSLGACMAGREDWRAAAEGIVAWAERTLRRDDGLWGGSQAAEPDYFTLDADGRAAAEAPFVDRNLYTGWNAHWIRALAEAGGRLGRTDWIERAAGALDTLLERMLPPGELPYHDLGPDGEPRLQGILVDAVELGTACVAVAQSAGRPDALERAGAIVAALQDRLWAVEGSFYDYPKEQAGVGALRFRDRPFEANAAAARLLVDLSMATGERGHRAVAERVLATLSPLAGRYGVAGAVFALAVEEFFEPPPRIVVTGDDDAAASLRLDALALPVADRRVWTLPEGGRIGANAFAADGGAAAYVCGGSGCSRALRSADALRAGLDALR